MLRELRGRVPLAVCTMKMGFYARKVIAAFAWDGLLDCVLGSEEGFAPKPAPDMLFELCRRLSVEPADALYVGDTALDARMAAGAGMPFGLVTWGYGRLEDIVGLPCKTAFKTPQDLVVFARIHS